MKMTMAGLQEAQRDNLKRIAQMKPGGSLDQAVHAGTIAAHRYAVILTHVDTSALKHAHRVDFKRGLFGPKGTVFIDPSAPGIRKKNGHRRVMAAIVKPAVYGPHEHARGGSHAFYERVEREYGNSIARQSAGMIVRSMH